MRHSGPPRACGSSSRPWLGSHRKSGVGAAPVRWPTAIVGCPNRFGANPTSGLAVLSYRKP
jgi:hypothetical protein